MLPIRYTIAIAIKTTTYLYYIYVNGLTLISFIWELVFINNICVYIIIYYLLKNVLMYLKLIIIFVGKHLLSLIIG